MKKLIMLATLGLAVVFGPSLAADAAATAPAANAKAQRVSAKVRTLKEKGRYHALHVTKNKMDCEDCHGGGGEDVLFLRTGEFQGKEGPVDRKECLECHQPPKKPGFYGLSK